MTQSSQPNPIANKKAGRGTRTEALKASLAEHMAEGGSFGLWSLVHDVTPIGTARIWGKIRRDLGAQAV